MAIELSSDFAKNIQNDKKRQALVETVQALAQAAVEISKICARGPLEKGLGTETGGANTDGDAQKQLDVRADEIITRLLERADVAYYASEEQDVIMTLDKGKTLAVAADPLDGSSNIDTNISIGTIFSIFPTGKDATTSFFRCGSEQLCGGFFVYGPQTSLIVTTGQGVDVYILDARKDRFVVALRGIEIPQNSTEYAINASNHNYWSAPVRSWVEDCLAGEDGPFGEKYNMRWVGSLVADAGRILSRGGVFLYPADDRKGYQNGRLRLLYEANPVAFVIEQAGGIATDGTLRILGMKLDSLHQRVPLVFGSEKPVQMIASYHHRKSIRSDEAQLFGNRGLFR